MLELYILIVALAAVEATHFIRNVNETVHNVVVISDDEPWDPEMYAKKIILRNMTGSVTPNTLSLLTELEELYIVHSSLDEIHPEAFKGTEQLETLQFSYNYRLPFLSNELFKNCPNLKKIIIGHNMDVEGIAENLLSDLRNLEYVEITGESKIPRKLKKEFFRNSKSLETIKIHSSNITAIESQTFEGLDNLKFLSFAENELVELDHRAFSSKNLVELYLGWNKLSSFTGNEILDLKKLTNLMLFYNPLTNVNLDKIRKNAPNLKLLSLEKSSLSCDEKEYLMRQNSSSFHVQMDQMEIDKCET